MAGWMDKIKDLAKGNPTQAGSAIEKVEDLIDQRTGGKYADQVDKGGDALREQLGLPGDEGGTAAPPQTTPEPAPAPAPEPAPTPAPAPEPAPAPNPEPATNDPQQPGSLGEGSIVPGDNEQVGQPGGPIDPQQPGADQPTWGSPSETTPDGGGDTSTLPTQPSQHQDGLPQGGSTQQGEWQSGDAVPGGKQPDDGGPGRA